VSADQIVISYRHADAGGWARSLHDSLEERLGPGRAFRDVVMRSSMDFHQQAETLLDRCDVVLAMRAGREQPHQPLGRYASTLSREASSHHRTADVSLSAPKTSGVHSARLIVARRARSRWRRPPT
jgi:hypothetical protein